jgi:hypothetical protein
MAKCWRCGGGKTISVTTTGTHVLPCPTCGGSGESPLAQGVEKNKVDSQHPELDRVAIAKPPAADLSPTCSKVA